MWHTLGSLVLLGCGPFCAVSLRAQVAKVDSSQKTPATGTEQPGLRALDGFMRRFMQRNDLPGGVLAVTRCGRLVYERGFGFADVAKEEKVQPGACFRIASLSKPITAVAVLQLVEQGKLSLDAKVFDLLAPKPFRGRAIDPRWKKVTILQLLQHRGGWNRVSGFDPMFRSHLVAAEAGHPGPATPWDVIRYMAGRELQFEPGEYYSYSNFGYCLLGRVIEKVTKQSYGDRVRKSVFAPLGLTGIHLGQTLRRRDGEVRYYGQPWRKARSVFAPKDGLTVPWEYGGFYLEAMDSHGGWVARARDLLRFACDFDDAKKSKLLRASTVKTMFARPPGYAGTDEKGRPRDVFYSCGWLVSKDFQDHGGSLPGTTAKLVRRADGVNWVVLFNSRRDAKGKRIHPDHVQGEMQRLLDCVEAWPTCDLFAR